MMLLAIISYLIQQTTTIAKSAYLFFKKLSGSFHDYFLVFLHFLSKDLYALIVI
ncbi:hypothetical protein LPICM02_340074 [Pseudolactococcus piscium]|nr:hypothetical protein LPICM02_340074 [Lactococcus piscium]